MNSKSIKALIGAHAVLVIAIIVMASVPPVSRDALTHHLALPKLWIQHGGLTEFSDMSFSYYPPLLELLYTIPVYLHHDIAAKYIHFGFALLTAMLVFLYLKHRLNAVWGGLGSLMFLSIPITIKLSVTAYVDLGLLFFSTGALFSGLIWLEAPQKKRWLLLAGLLSGLALLVKYNAMVSFAVLTLLLPLFYLRSHPEDPKRTIKAVSHTLVLVFIALLVFSPWAIRNVHLTGNPIYPLHQELFSTANDTPNDSLMPDKNAPLSPLLARKVLHDESLPYILLVPLRIFFQGQDDDPRTFDGQLSPMLLLLPLILLLARYRPKRLVPGEIAFLSLYASLIVLYSFLTTPMRIRYVITMLPALIVLSVYGLYALREALNQQQKLSGPMKNSILALVLALFFVPNALYALDLYRRIDPLPYLRNEIDRDQYIAQHLGEYPLVSLSNQLVPQGNKLLALHLGNRRYYFDVDTLLSNDLLWDLARQTSSGEGVANQLINNKISHLLIRLDIFNQLTKNRDPGLQQVLADFFAHHTRLLASRNGYGLYRLETARGHTD